MARMDERPLGTGRRELAVGYALVAMGVGVVGLAGCGSGDPNRPLSNEEGEALLESIRANPPRPDDLTIAEKKWLLKRMGR